MSLIRLHCNDRPALKIYVESADPRSPFREFVGGKLLIDTDDPAYETVMRVVAEDPGIALIVNTTTCEYCGEVFEGEMGRLNVAQHIKELHFDKWEGQLRADQARTVAAELKSRSAYACTVCSPIQDFPDEERLAQHTRILHNVVTESDLRAGAVEGSAPYSREPATTDSEESAGRHRRPGEIDLPGAFTPE